MTEPEDPELKNRMAREEAERYRDEHALDLAHLAYKRSMSLMRERLEAMKEHDPPGDPA
jgi:hypothetical protein